MISNNNSALTKDEIDAYNAAIESFIKRNSNYVDLSDRDDGYTYITLRYGPVRDVALKEIATRCKNSLIDDVFKIGVLECNISYANGSILRFKGKTSEILEGMKQLDSSSYGGLVTKSKANVELPENFAQTVATIVKKYTIGRKDFTDTIKKNEGLNFYQSGNKDHFGVDLNVLAKHISTAASPRDDAVTLNTVCQTIIALYRENSKIITETLATQLEKLYVQLERVNANINLFAYDVINDTAAGDNSSSGEDSGSGQDPVTPPANEFEYTKVPGKVSKLIVHFGDVTTADVAKTDFKSETLEFVEGYPCEVLTDTDDVVVGVGPEGNLSDLVGYYKKLSTPSKVLISLETDLEPDSHDNVSLNFLNSIVNVNNESLITFIKTKVHEENENIAIEDVSKNQIQTYIMIHGHVGTNEGVVLLDTHESNSDSIQTLFGGGPINTIFDTLVTSSNVESIYTPDVEGNVPEYDTFSTIDFNGNVIAAAINSGRAIDIYLM